MANSIETKEDTFMNGLKNLPMSVKFIFKIMEYNGLLTQKEIAEETGLPKRTVRYALNIMDEEGLLEKRIHKDARQTLYGLKSLKSHSEVEAANFSCIYPL